eukprot:GHVS01008201.1.p1 GENE.GHVS01008201.1~~GHVS01008201.1.p1  ORF type:complete len:164 (+),score=8.53 GHVS01008201.1:163-654(+)
MDRGVDVDLCGSKLSREVIRHLLLVGVIVVPYGIWRFLQELLGIFRSTHRRRDGARGTLQAEKIDELHTFSHTIEGLCKELACAVCWIVIRHTPCLHMDTCGSVYSVSIYGTARGSAQINIICNLNVRSKFLGQAISLLCAFFNGGTTGEKEREADVCVCVCV